MRINTDQNHVIAYYQLPQMIEFTTVYCTPLIDNHKTFYVKPDNNDSRLYSECYKVQNGLCRRIKVCWSLPDNQVTNNIQLEKQQSGKNAAEAPILRYINCLGNLFFVCAMWHLQRLESIFYNRITFIRRIETVWQYFLDWFDRATFCKYFPDLSYDYSNIR